MLKITQAADTVVEDYFGVKLTIARTNSEAFLAKFRKVTRPYRKQIASGSMDMKRSDELMCEAMAGTVLVDWEDFKAGGEDVPFSIENAVDLLIHDRDCRDFVSRIAGDLQAFVDEEIEDAAKNL